MTDRIYMAEVRVTRLLLVEIEASSLAEADMLIAAGDWDTEDVCSTEGAPEVMIGPWEADQD